MGTYLTVNKLLYFSFHFLNFEATSLMGHVKSFALLTSLAHRLPSPLLPRVCTGRELERGAMPGTTPRYFSVDGRNPLLD